MSLAKQYLIERGLPIEIAIVNGIEFDLNPTRERTEQRLGVGCVPLWKSATEILWIPLYTSADSCSEPLPRTPEPPGPRTASGLSRLMRSKPNKENRAN
jgi:hypothetical protein